MTPLVFPSYGVSYSGPREVHVIAEQIETYHAIDYNGNPGTEIQLKSGKKLRVGCWPGEVTQKLNAINELRIQRELASRINGASQ